MSEKIGLVVLHEMARLKVFQDMQKERPWEPLWRRQKEVNNRVKNYFDNTVSGLIICCFEYAELLGLKPKRTDATLRNVENYRIQVAHFVFEHNKLYAIECSIPSHLKEVQDVMNLRERYRSKVEAEGGIYKVVTTFQEFYKFLEYFK